MTAWCLSRSPIVSNRIQSTSRADCPAVANSEAPKRTHLRPPLELVAWTHPPRLLHQYRCSFRRGGISSFAGSCPRSSNTRSRRVPCGDGFRCPDSRHHSRTIALSADTNRCHHIMQNVCTPMCRASDLRCSAIVMHMHHERIQVRCAEQWSGPGSKPHPDSRTDVRVVVPVAGKHTYRR